MTVVAGASVQSTRLLNRTLLLVPNRIIGWFGKARVRFLTTIGSMVSEKSPNFHDREAAALVLQVRVAVNTFAKSDGITEATKAGNGT
jgi:hypothetical protein